MKPYSFRRKLAILPCASMVMIGIAVFNGWCKVPLFVLRVLAAHEMRFTTSGLERYRTIQEQIGWTKLGAQPFDVTANDGTLLKCLFVTNSSLPEARGTVIILHGLGGNKERELWLARDLFSTNGFNSVFYDSRAHGESGGRFCFLGVKEAPDIGVILDAAEKKFGSLKNVGIFGSSLGAAVAIQAMPITPRLKCGVVFSPFSRSRDVLNEMQMEWMRWLQKRYSPPDAPDIDGINLLECAPNVKIPVLVAHGDQDAMIPVQQGEMVFKKLGSADKIFLPVPQSGHKNMWNADAPIHHGLTLRNAVIQFFMDHLDRRDFFFRTVCESVLR